MALKYILFDLDGTLTNSSEGITNCIRYAFSEMGREVPSHSELLEYIGPPLVSAFQELAGFTHGEALGAVEKFRKRYDDIGLFENKPYNNIEEVLIELNNMDKKLIVATSKPEYLAGKILDHFGLSRYFVEIVGSTPDEKRVSKKDVIMEVFHRLDIDDADKKNVIMIGDRRYDILGAHDCGLKAIGVYYGFAEKGELEEAGADYIVYEVSDIPKTIRSI